MGEQGETATNKDNNISKIIDLDCCHMSPNIVCFCKLMAKIGTKVFPRACIGFFCG